MGKRRPQLDPPDDDVDEPMEEASGSTPLHWARFALGAVRRRPALAAAVFLMGVGASVISYRLRTPMYRVEATILAQRQQAIASVARASRPDDSPTRSAWELIHRKENLVAVVSQADLPVPSPSSAPGLPGRLKRLLGSAPIADDPMNLLLRRLDSALKVTVSEGTVAIGIDWQSPQEAYRIVKAAVENFLEARHLQEVTALDEVISLMQARLAALADQLERVSAAARRQPTLQPLAGLDSPPRAPQPAVPPPGESAAAEEGAGAAKLAQLRSMIEAKERAIADVEDFRRRRLADLQAQLDQMLGVYSDQHPTVITLRQDIEALSRESPQIAALRDDQQKLRGAYAAGLAQEGRTRPSIPRAPGPAVARPASGLSEESERVREARMQYQQMVERVNAAQIELDAARAAFKYRYDVLWPAEVPRAPVSPSAKKILGLGSLAALLLAVLAAAAADWRAGRIFERWQVEQLLDLPILAEIDRK